jgi:uncharacterized circularly permuted ATP-grasp superfamily protein
MPIQADKFQIIEKAMMDRLEALEHIIEDIVHQAESER